MRKIYLFLALLFCAFSTPSYAINCAVANGACFWVGGTGTMDLATDSSHWSNSSGGASCSCEPISTNTLTFDASSGGGTVTVAATGSLGTTTVVEIVMGAFTGTLDFSANNPSMTFSGTTGFSLTGTGTRTLNCGSGTFTLSGGTAGGGNIWDNSTVTNETISCASATIVLSAASPAGTRTFSAGSKSYGTLTINAATSPTVGPTVSISSSPTFANLNVTGPNWVSIGTGNVTITNGFNWTQASSAAPILVTGGNGSTATITSANNGTVSWAMITGLTFTGGGTFSATNSLSLGANSGITITAPSLGGGGRIIGG